MINVELAFCLHYSNIFLPVHSTFSAAYIRLGLHYRDIPNYDTEMISDSEAFCHTENELFPPKIMLRNGLL